MRGDAVTRTAAACAVLALSCILAGQPAKGDKSKPASSGHGAQPQAEADPGTTPKTDTKAGDVPEAPQTPPVEDPNKSGDSQKIDRTPPSGMQETIIYALAPASGQKSDVAGMATGLLILASLMIQVTAIVILVRTSPPDVRGLLEPARAEIGRVRNRLGSLPAPATARPPVQAHPAPSPQPRSRPVGTATRPAQAVAPQRFVEPARPEPSRQTPVAASRGRASLTAEYNNVRSAGGRSRDVERFQSLFPFTTLDCLNASDWRYNRNAIIRFMPASRGWFMAVQDGGVTMVLPAFNVDFNREVEQFEPVFQYPAESGSVRLKRAGVLRQQGEEYVLQAPGEFERDA